MNVEVIAIGDELLLGQTLNTNAAWLGQEIARSGGTVVCSSAIADRPEDIRAALDSVRSDVEWVILTGGLGPTKDDLTKKVLTEYFGGQLEYRPEVYEHIVQIFASLGRIPSERNREQAFLPDNAEIISNPIGTAMGMMWQRNHQYFVSLPGVPYEMKRIMSDRILPWIQNVSQYWVAHRTVRTQGVPESELADRIADWEDQLPPEIKLAYLPSPGWVKLRLSIRVLKDEESRWRTELDHRLAALRVLLGPCYFGEGDDSLEEMVSQQLKASGQTVSVAESCTGGLLGAALTSLPGSSAFFQGGILAYSNEVKMRQLGVDEAALMVHGAVSEPVAKAMASGVRKRLGTDWGYPPPELRGPMGDRRRNRWGLCGLPLPDRTGALRSDFKWAEIAEETQLNPFKPH